MNPRLKQGIVQAFLKCTDDEGDEYEIEVLGQYYLGARGTHEDPPDDPEMEVTKAFDEDGAEIRLNQEQEARAIDALWIALADQIKERHEPDSDQ